MPQIDVAVMHLRQAKGNADEVGAKQIDEAIRMLQGAGKMPEEPPIPK